MKKLSDGRAGYTSESRKTRVETLIKTADIIYPERDVILRGRIMIKNSKKIQEFEEKLVRSKKVDIAQNFKIVEAMYREAVELHAIPVKDPLYGIEIDIKIAKVVNSV